MLYDILLKRKGWVMKMENGILNLEQAASLLEISEKTLIKLLKEEHLPARKLGREWRFSKDRLIQWLAEGDSNDYSNQSDYYLSKLEKSNNLEQIFCSIEKNVDVLRTNNSIKNIFKELPANVTIPDNAELNVIYKQKGDAEKLEFKISWLTQNNE